MAFLGFFGFLGRSRDLRDLDLAFRSVDLHPALVPEAVKLAMLKLLKAASSGADMPRAAALVAYCMLGAEAFAHANGDAATEAVEARIGRALQAGDDLDAQLILLTLHAKVIQPSVVAEFELEAA